MSPSRERSRSATAFATTSTGSPMSAAIDPAEAWELCVADAIRLDAMSDPVALAAQRIAERAFDQGVRISGLGRRDRAWLLLRRTGRGPRLHPQGRRAARLLADVRQRGGRARPARPRSSPRGHARRANDQVYDALRAGGDEWFRAADELYVRHRMQRWAGATDIAVSDQRIVVNPMLDPDFLDIAARLTPQRQGGLTIPRRAADGARP